MTTISSPPGIRSGAHMLSSAVAHSAAPAAPAAPRVARRKAAFPRAEDLSMTTIREAQAGDLEAFRTIVESLDRLIFQTVYRLVASRFHADVPDITQEILIKLHRNLGRFDTERGTKFHSWVLAMVRNYCFDVLKRRRLPTVSMTSLTEDESEDLLPSNDVDPRDQLASLEVQAFIGREVQGLPEQQRFAFILREYEGLSYHEIADACECSEGTVKSRIHRAKESLRRRLGPWMSQLSR